VAAGAGSRDAGGCGSGSCRTPRFQRARPALEGGELRGPHGKENGGSIKARIEKNLFAPAPEVIAEARAHFADHCAICHANNGSGNTEIGQNLYPKAPDLRLPQTQSLTDGELYHTIHNGIRLTGMPAWGTEGKDDDRWKLVLFIRHLPQLTSEEEREMEALNPKGPGEKQEELDEEQFLNQAQPNHQTAKLPTHHGH